MINGECIPVNNLVSSENDNHHCTGTTKVAVKTKDSREGMPEEESFEATSENRQ